MPRCMAETGFPFYFSSESSFLVFSVVSVHSPSDTANIKLSSNFSFCIKIPRFASNFLGLQSFPGIVRTLEYVPPFKGNFVSRFSSLRSSLEEETLVNAGRVAPRL